MRRLFSLFTVLFICASAHAVEVKTSRVPDGGMQPQVLVQGAITHLVYLKGDPSACDVVYRSSTDGGQTWSGALRVNSTPNSAIARGTIRGAQLAVGRDGNVFVVWNASPPKAKPMTGMKMEGMDMGSDSPDRIWFARLRKAQAAFEPQRNLMTHTFHLDGGASIAADEKGRVYVGWHANGRADQEEADRQPFVSVSQDDGATFSEEKAAWPEPAGSCACCQVKLAAEDNGQVWMLYRSAKDVVHRDTYLLKSTDAGKTFRGIKVDDWQINTCPMSSYSFDFASGTKFAAWETMEQIHYGVLPGAGAPKVLSAQGSAPRRKYPVLATTANGETVLAWTENSAWGRGGNFAYEVVDKDGKPIGEVVKGDKVPAWSYVAVYPMADGNVGLLY